MTATMDQADRDRVTGSLSESLVVEAGAGTGKTTAVVSRIATLLAEGVATVDDLAVVTFTNDAAAELVTRVRERLEQSLADTKNPEQHARLLAAQAGLYRARISTLHVFATNLLRERPVEARVDPGLRTLNQVERAERMDASFETWLSEVLAGDDVRVRVALNRGLDLPQLRKLCDLIDQQRAALPLAPVATAPIDHAAFRGHLAAAVATLAKLEGQCVDPDDGAVLQYPAIIEFASLVDEADDLALERIALERAPRINSSVGRQPNWSTKEACIEFKAALKTCKEAITEYVSALRAAAVSDLMPLAEEFVLRFSDERRAEGLADFDDLLLWARDLLRSDAGARRWLHARYRYVLIDEFQDTDPLQAELALLLTSGADEGDWRDLRPEPGALVVVGDPKQAIYRFRRADIATYDAVRDGALGGQLATLRQNFRSVGDIIVFANDVFERRFAAGEPGRQAAHVALQTKAPERADDRRAAVVLVTEKKPATDKLKADEVHAREVDLLVRTLRLAVQEERWLVRDGSSTRPATWGDVAILTPSVKGIINTLGPALEAAGIPYRASAGRGLYLQPEITELVSILHAIDDPTDAVHVVGALCSDAFGCSADDLIQYAAIGGTFDPRHIHEDGPSAVTEGLKTLAIWRAERRGLSLPELVQRVIDGSGLVELALEQPGGAQVAGNVLRVVEEARTFAGTGGGLRSFTQWLSTRRDIDEESDEAVMTDPDDPVVRIMTIHGAKGLEYPIVALAGLDSKGSTNPPDVIGRPDEHRIELRVGGDFATPKYQDLADHEKELLQLERDRLLYVAVTRARDHLIVPAIRTREHTTGHLAALMPSLPERAGDNLGCDVAGVHVLDPKRLPATTEPPAHAASRAADPAEAVQAAVRAEEAWMRGRSAARDLAERELLQTVASSVRPFDRIRPLAADSTGTADDEAGADLNNAPPLEVGTALHRVMDRIPLDGSTDPLPLARAACLEAGIPDATAHVAQLVAATLDSPAIQRASASGTARREVPFTVALPDGLGYAVGRVDLLFRDGDELIVVDYKTEALPNANPGTLADAAQQHSGQGLVYAAAVTRATGIPVREVVFVFPSVRGEYVLVIDDDAIGAAERHLVSGEVSEFA